ncbi:FtsX-like permease family protein [Streptomyces sp. NPDC050145]|uniref:FtsX-like permease family protein n=1 Tax=Streptomyces sp. NPDC050145 TaxID=3365602 RepID=UPI0037B7C807
MLTRGADRLERRRAALTVLGATAASGFGGAALTLVATSDRARFPFGNGLLDGAGTRHGVIAALVLLLVPVLGFLGQCARVGAVHRDRRLAALRLAGGGPRQVRRIAALETGGACLAGALIAAAGFGVGVWRMEPVTGFGAWNGDSALIAAAAMVVAMPVLGVLVSAFALRKVVASPLGTVRRQRPGRGPGPVLGFAVPALVVLAAAALVLLGGRQGSTTSLPLFVIGTVVLTGAAAIWTAGASARTVGRRLGARTERPSVLLAAHRLQEDPWAASRSHATLVLVTVVGVGFAGIAEIFVEGLHRSQAAGTLGMDIGYYTFGLWLTAAAVGVALLISLAGLAVGTAESLSTRRRALAAQAAAGVPRRVLTRALLLETALPLAPGLVLATVGGTAIHVAYAFLLHMPVPWALPLLVPVAVFAVCLLAAATALPLLTRSLSPEQLRVA